MAQAMAAVAPTGQIQNSRQDHSSSSKLEDQAALAALYVTKYDNSKKSGHQFLDRDNKLSSAGAAASLKYASPQDLPSYPSSGLRNGNSAAGAAASLGWANQKSVEQWKPDSSASASAAASLGWANQKSIEQWKPDSSASASAAAVHAKDYKMAPAWQPEQSAHGAKAALIAHKNDGKVEVWKPEVTNWGSSAATQAFKNDRERGLSSTHLDDGHTALGRKGSLMAATGAMSTSRRRAATTSAVPGLETYPDEANAASNALSAATSAHKLTRRSNFSADLGAVPYTNMSRDMFTSHPPVAVEVEERNRKDTIHASAVAMAKSMYNIQQRQIDAATNAQRGAMAAHRRSSSASSSEELQPMRFNNLQEAAQKLAQERLAKLHEEHTKNREYREYRDYYGSSAQPQSRLSIRNRPRRRASSDGNINADKKQSNKIREQMSLFSSNLSEVDAKKRQQDREALIAVAQRNVTKSLHGMDERIFADTGKVAPSLLNEWELKAHAAAQAKSDTRMENYGKVDIGGGKFINQSAVDLVAARNVQPVLDEINEKAEAERERQAALKLEQETQQRKAVEKKQREKEEKEINKKIKQQDKEERKAKEAEEKASKNEEKRLEKERRKSQKVDDSAAVATTENVVEESEVKNEPETIAGATSEPAITADATNEPAKIADATHEPGTTADTTNESVTAAEPANKPAATPEIANESATIAERREVASVPTPIRTSMEDQASTRMRENADAANPDEATPLSPSSPNSKVKNWLKSKLSRRSGKITKSEKEKEKEKEPTSQKPFVGGAALTGATAGVNDSTTSLGDNNSSVKDVALATSAGKIKKRRPRNSGDSDVSSLSTGEVPVEEDDEFQEARDNFDENLAPPPTFSVEKSSSPVRAARFTEEI